MSALEPLLSFTYKSRVLADFLTLTVLKVNVFFKAHLVKVPPKISLPKSAKLSLKVHFTALAASTLGKLENLNPYIAPPRLFATFIVKTQFLIRLV